MVAVERGCRHEASIVAIHGVLGETLDFFPVASLATKVRVL